MALVKFEEGGELSESMIRVARNTWLRAIGNTPVSTLMDRNIDLATFLELETSTYHSIFSLARGTIITVRRRLVDRVDMLAGPHGYTVAKAWIVQRLED